MNRDRYLSKAKDKDTGEWWIGYYVHCDAKCVHPDLRHEIHTLCGCRMTIDPNTLCQCTGYRDGNGELIFEGDKLLCGGIMVLDILCDNGVFCLIDNYTQSKISIYKLNENVKIIGNKFDEEQE